MTDLDNRITLDENLPSEVDISKSFVELETFKYTWKNLGLDDEDLRYLENQIIHNPQQWISLGSEVYKIYYSPKDSNKGKNTSHRVLYINLVKKDQIYLHSAFSKADMANISKDTLENIKEVSKKLNS